MVWWQLRELQRTLRLAYQRIPFYQKLYNAHGISPDDVRTFDDIRRLPIVSKQMLRGQQLEEIMDGAFGGRVNWKETSGSSGEPFRFPSSDMPYLMRKFGPVCVGARTLSFLAWNKIRYRKKVFERMRVADIRVHHQPRAGHFLHIPVADLRERPETIIPRLKEFAPNIINSRATVLVELARLAERLSPDERPQPRYIISHGEVLTEAQRKYIGKIFGAEPYNRYGLEEVGSVAVDCAEHRGGHIHEESFVTEIVDEAACPLPEGQTGRIILTYFYNHVMPFIRYDTGDLGRIVAEPCPCGVQARRLIVDGRKGGFITIGARRFNNVEFEVLLSNFSDNILRYQIAKTSADTIEIRIIPTKNFSREQQAMLESQFQEKFGFAPRVKIVNDISYTVGGKTRFIIDESQSKPYVEDRLGLETAY